MKNRVLSLLAIVALGASTAQPLTKDTVQVAKSLTAIMATIPNVYKLVEGKVDNTLETTGLLSSFAYEVTSAALESNDVLALLNRFIITINENKKFGSITEWNKDDKNQVYPVLIGVGGQLVKEISNHFSGKFINDQLSGDQKRLMRRLSGAATRAVSGSVVDMLVTLTKNKALDQKVSILDTLLVNLSKNLALGVLYELAGEGVQRLTEDTPVKDISMKELLCMECPLKK